MSYGQAYRSRRFLGLILSLALVASLPIAPSTAQETPPPSEPADRVELEGKRTATSRTFSNPDGSLTTELFESPIHFREDREWKKIDSDLVATDRPGFAWRNAANDFKLFFKDVLEDEFVAFQFGGKTFTMSMNGASHAPSDRGPDAANSPTGSDMGRAKPDVTETATGSPSPAPPDGGPTPSPTGSVSPGTSPSPEKSEAPSPSAPAPAESMSPEPTPEQTPDEKPPGQQGPDGREDHIRYNGAFPGVDVSYGSTATGVKETIILSGPQAPTEYRFTLAGEEGSDLQARRDWNGSWLVFDGAVPMFALESPFVVDKSGIPPDPSHNPVSMSLRTQDDGSISVALSLDRRWLRDPDRRFPVRIDPTIVIQPTLDDGTVLQNCAQCTVAPWEQVYVGTTNSTVYRGLFKFDINDIPRDANITGATFEPYTSSAFYATPPNTWQMDLHRTTASWTPNYTFPAQVAYDSTILSSWTYNTPSPAMSVTSTVQNWVTGTQANNGLLLKARSEALNVGGVMIQGKRSTWGLPYMPLLRVTYTTDGVNLFAPKTVTGAGAVLNWNRYSPPSGAPFQRYEVHRSLDRSFQPSASTLIATIGDVNQTTYTDTTAAPNTEFSYKVVANSSSSNRQTVTTPANGQGVYSVQPGPSESTDTSITYLPDGAYTCGSNGQWSRLSIGRYPVTGGPYKYRSLLRFALDEIPSSATIQTAKLSLYQVSVSGNYAIDVGAFRLNKPWKEGTSLPPPNDHCDDGARWKESEAGSPWAVPGGDFEPVGTTPRSLAAGASGWQEFDVSPLVQDWVGGAAPNYGFILKAADETTSNYGYHQLMSSDDPSYPTLPPKLTINYSNATQAKGPSVTISSPAQGATVNGNVAVTAAASDDGKVAKVEFFKDGVSLGVDTSSPYAATWTTTKPDNGSHSLTAKATDDAGNTTTSSAVNVTVTNSDPPAASLTAPAAGATVSGSAITVSASLTDDAGLERAEFYFDDIRIGNPLSAPVGATTWSPWISWNTLDPNLIAYDGPHSLTVRAYDAQGQMTVSAARSVTVANTNGTKYKATITSSAVPQSMTYDPGAGTQQPQPVDVTVINKSTATWLRTDVVVRYRWLTPTGASVATGPDVSIGTTDMGANVARTLPVSVVPPALTDGIDRAQYTLRFDLFEKSTGTWFAAKGNGPVDNPVIVNKKINATALGIESYYGYEPIAVGAGMTQLTNVASGNSLLRWSPMSSAGRGLSTVVGFTYNSLEDKSDSPVGNNFSLAISGLTRLGLPIDIHPNNADTIAGRSNKWIEFTDADGTTFRFNQNANGGWDEPPGVHLYLRQFSTTDMSKKWAITRPDGVTFFYNDLGYPTGVEDLNGNRLAFTLADVPPGDDPGGFKKRVTAVTDASGLGGSPAPNRTYTIDYYTKAEVKKPQVRGKIEKITDHDGSALLFDYYEDGNLLRVTEKGGTTAAGGFLADRTFVFTYTNSAGGAAAITDPSARVSPDPKTPNQSSRLFSVRDPRGNETTFTYFTTGAAQDKWKLKSVANRMGDVTSFAYDITTRITTVTPPTPTGEASRQQKFHYDTDGKVDQFIDALGKTTTLTWSSDRQLTKVTEPSGAYTEFAYNANGYLTDTWDPLRNRTVLTYDNVAVDANDVSTKWKAGRSIPHISRVKTKTAPDLGQWVFTYDVKGNLTRVTDPETNPTVYTYNSDGTLATATDARGVATTTDPNDFVTRYQNYDANGLPTRIQDATGGVTLMSYDDDGRLQWTQDPNHTARSAPADDYNRTRFTYDSFGRLGKVTTPKDGGTIIVTTTDFDPNDNVVSQSAPGEGVPGKAATATYDKMDRLTSGSNEENETTSYAIDSAGRVTRITEPRGSELASTDKDFATFLSYDALDRVVRQTNYDVDLATGAVRQTMTTHSCFDALTGDRTSVTSPRANVASVTCSSPPQFTTKFTYDAAHRLKTVTDPENRVSTYGYDGNSNVKTIQDANGTTQVRSYDKLDRVVKVEQPFDTSVTPARMVTSRVFYDKVGNVDRVVSPRAWDASPDKTTFTDFVTSYSYDALNRLTRTELPSAAGTTKAYVHRNYDPNGNLDWTSLPVTNSLASGVPASQKTQITYYDTGWIASQDDPSTPPVHFDYNARGQQVLRQENDAAVSDLAQNAPQRWDYFDDGMLKTRTKKVGPGPSVTYTYDRNNNLATAADTLGGQSPQRLTAVVDSANRLVTTKQKTDADAAWRVTSYTYDLDSNVSKRIDDALEGSATDIGREQVFTYDKTGWLTSQLDKGTQTACGDDRRIDNAYTPIGLEQQRQMFKADGACAFTTTQTTNWTYFANGKLKTLVTKDRNNAVVESHDIKYVDAGVYVNGFRTRDDFLLKGPDSGAQCFATCAETFTYDARDRLIGDNRTPGVNRQYDLDVLGNVITEKAGGVVQRRYDYTGADGLPTPKLKAVLNPDSSVSSRYFYDSDNVDCITEAAGGAGDCNVPSGSSPNVLADYTYDVLDRLTRVRSFTPAGAVVDDTTYDYDALDRVFKQVENKGAATQRTTTFTYQGLTDLTTKEIRKNNSGVVTTQKSFTYDAVGNRISMINDPDGEGTGDAPSAFTYAYDPHGSVSVLLADTGAPTVKATYAYEPYGKQDTSVSRGDNDLENSFNPYRYTAKRWDSGSAQLDMGFRRFAPDIGRFMQPDVYGGALADLGLSMDPITGGNRYSLGGGNPISFVEVDGHYQTYDNATTQDEKRGGGDPDAARQIPNDWVYAPEARERRRKNFGDPGFKGLVNFVDGALDCGLGLDDSAQVQGETFAASYALGCGYTRTAEIVGLGKGVLSLGRWVGRRYLVKQTSEELAERVSGSAFDDVLGLSDDAIEGLSSSQRKTVKSLQDRISEHLGKIDTYRADPDSFDNLGILQSAPSPDIRERIIAGRIRHLEHEVSNWADQIRKLTGGGT